MRASSPPRASISDAVGSSSSTSSTTLAPFDATSSGAEPPPPNANVRTGETNRNRNRTTTGAIPITVANACTASARAYAHAPAAPDRGGDRVGEQRANARVRLGDRLPGDQGHQAAHEHEVKPVPRALGDQAGERLEPDHDERREHHHPEREPDDVERRHALLDQEVRPVGERLEVLLGDGEGAQAAEVQPVANEGVDAHHPTDPPVRLIARFAPGWEPRSGAPDRRRTR